MSAAGLVGPTCAITPEDEPLLKPFATLPTTIAPADRDRLLVWFNGIRVAHKGARDPSYNETEVSQAMKAQVISLKVGIGLGKGKDRVLTCDLTKEYVAINGDYRS